MKKLLKSAMFLVLIIFAMISTTSCYVQDEITGTQIGLKMSDGLKIDEVVGSGRYIEVDENYKQKLNEKALSRINLELLQQKNKEAEEQVKQEEAKTLVDIEIAKRNNLVAEEENKIFAMSPEAYELEKLRLLQGILGTTDKVYFVPAGTDISLWITGEGSDSKIATANKE